MRQFFFFFCLVLLCFSHCARRKARGRLGVDYYKMSTAELKESDGNMISYRQALRHIDKALCFDDRAEYLAHKATLLFLLGQESESGRFFKRSLKKRSLPDVHAEILNNYACLIASCGKRERALELFKSLESDRNYLTPEVALVNQAKIYYEKDSFEDARSTLLRAIDLAPDYVDAHYYLGLVFYELDEYATALRMAEKTIALESGHYGAKLLQERVMKLSIY